MTEYSRDHYENGDQVPYADEPMSETTPIEPMSDENARMFIEQVGHGCTSGSFAEWPQLRPVCRSILARIDRLQAVVDRLVAHQEDYRRETYGCLCPGNSYWSSRLILIVNEARSASGLPPISCSQCGQPSTDKPCGCSHAKVYGELAAAEAELATGKEAPKPQPATPGGDGQ